MEQYGKLINFSLFINISIINLTKFTGNIVHAYSNTLMI